MLTQDDLSANLWAWMAPFRCVLSAPTWRNALALIAGTILAPGRRTVTTAIHHGGLGATTRFTNYHRVLNRNRWSPLVLARQLLLMLVARLQTNPLLGLPGAGRSDHEQQLTASRDLERIRGEEDRVRGSDRGR
jgi:hypothetical protein